MTEPTVSLLEGARIIARGGDLDSKLAALAAHARSASDARLVTLHLLDHDGQSLVPAAADGQTTGSPTIIDLTTAHPAIASALADRRPGTFAHGPDTVVSLPFLPPDARTIMVIPLMTESDDGGTQVDGLLLAATSTVTEDVPDPLVAMADLAAVAIRQTRLENALNERADWLDRMANTDPLTGLANRRTFDRMLELEVARAGRQGATIGIAIFSVDRLDEIRATAGESVADDLLRSVAATLAEQLRLVDTVARFGRDTFASICPGSPGPEAARRVRDAVSKLPVADGAGPLSVTAGLASFPATAVGAEALLTAAEGALADAMVKGPGWVVESSPKT